jgi:hypothetical protein
MIPGGLEPTIPTSERQLTHTLDCAYCCKWVCNVQFGYTVVLYQENVTGLVTSCLGTGIGITFLKEG